MNKYVNINLYDSLIHHLRSILSAQNAFWKSIGNPSQIQGNALKSEGNHLERESLGDKRDSHKYLRVILLKYF